MRDYMGEISAMTSEMSRAGLDRRFLLLNAVVWLTMVVILVLVPDTLEAWVPLTIARVLGWAVTCAVWVAVVEGGWRKRLGPFARFFVQVVLWVAAATVAMWISDQFRMGG
jgi:hypothetical protein